MPQSASANSGALGDGQQSVIALGPVPPEIDESGYAALIVKREPFYEPVCPDEVSYDDVPRRYSMHEYMNTNLCRDAAEGSEKNSTASFPDLLEMVTRSKTPSPVTRLKSIPDNTDLGQLYAKVKFTHFIIAV